MKRRSSFSNRLASIGVIYPLLIFAAIGIAAVVDLFINGPDPRLMRIAVLGTALGVLLPGILVLFGLTLSSSSWEKLRSRSDKGFRSDQDIVE